MNFKYLTNVHTGWNTQRVENDLNRTAVIHIRHILFRQDPGNNTLVAVTAGHLVTNLQFTLNGNIDLDHLDNTGRQIVTTFEFLNLVIKNTVDKVDLAIQGIQNLVNLVIGFSAITDGYTAPHVYRQGLERFFSYFFAFSQDKCSVIFFHLDSQSLVQQKLFQLTYGRITDNANLVQFIFAQFIFFGLLDQFRTGILVVTFTRENLGTNDGTLNTWRNGQ